MGRTLAVVGGGVIGSMIAWQAARKGWDTTIYERDPAESASWVAGGMLGCMGEARPGEDTALELARASARRWPDLMTALADPTIVVATDTVLVAAYLPGEEIGAVAFASNEDRGATLPLAETKARIDAEPMIGFALAFILGVEPTLIFEARAAD